MSFDGSRHEVLRYGNVSSRCAVFVPAQGRASIRAFLQYPRLFRPSFLPSFLYIQQVKQHFSTRFVCTFEPVLFCHRDTPAKLQMSVTRGWLRRKSPRKPGMKGTLRQIKVYPNPNLVPIPRKKPPRKPRMNGIVARRVRSSFVAILFVWQKEKGLRDCDATG